jgi:phosphatidylserine decarboxylase
MPPALTRAFWALLPKLLVSRLARALGRIPLPRRLRRFVYRSYARCYRADLDEAERDPREYRRFCDFFARGLRAGARPIAATTPVWPCDGVVGTAGPIRGGRIEQVKGIDYAVADLLADAALAGAVAGGTQATIYLAPGDYHRVHAPVRGRLLRVRHVAGGLYPVFPAVVRAVPGLFARNERLIFELELDDRRAGALVMVAALNVGDLAVTGPVPREFCAGDELGRFGFGSTVVVLLAAGATGFPAAAAGRRVRYGGAAGA